MTSVALKRGMDCCIVFPTWDHFFSSPLIFYAHYSLAASPQCRSWIHLQGTQPGASQKSTAKQADLERATEQVQFLGWKKQVGVIPKI